jgi:hypothetical protein
MDNYSQAHQAKASDNLNSIISVQVKLNYSLLIINY